MALTMTKQYPIVMIDGEQYAVDKERVDGGTYYCPHKGQNIDVGQGKAPNKPYFFMWEKKRLTNICPDCAHLIATTNKALGLPLIPLEDDAEELPKKWTDEDMYFAFRAGRKGFGGAIYQRKYTWETPEEYLKSLTTTLKGLEIEMEERCVYNGTCKKERCLAHSCDEKILQPKLTKDGYVIVTKYIYE